MDEALLRLFAPKRPEEASMRQDRLDTLSATEHPLCLMCSAANPASMKLDFRVQSDGSVLATFPCREMWQSYPRTLHGGVVAALVDAAMTNALFSIGVVAVTAELTVRFLAPVSLNRSAVVRASIDEESSHPLYYVRSEIIQSQKLMARASAKFLAKERATPSTR
jgi:uncharacterized protein (TIGR00369 family)